MVTPEIAKIEDSTQEVSYTTFDPTPYTEYALYADNDRQFVRVIEVKYKETLGGVNHYTISGTDEEYIVSAITEDGLPRVFVNREAAIKAARKLSKKLYGKESYPISKITRKVKKRKKQILASLKASQERRQYANLTDEEYRILKRHRKRMNIICGVATACGLLAGAALLTQLIEIIIKRYF